MTTGYVFTREDGTPMHPDYVTRHFDWLVRKAGLPPVRLHDLRHGAASLTYRASKDLKAVQSLLGHSQISITADTYTSLFEDTECDAAEAPRPSFRALAGAVFPMCSRRRRTTAVQHRRTKRKARSNGVGRQGIEP